MKKKIQNYIARIDSLLAEPPEGIDYGKEQQKHLVQIQFFMHERLVHEIVMVLFALLTVLVFIALVITQQLLFVILLIALLVLLVPYIMHYYTLENGVQYMYEQYDEMERRKETNQMDAE
ncbi:MAG: hypothetical protein IJ040_02980 [Lachnospiraceae bacterium]|nr:hypothetical protein [Lachnospiraceae bacterium]